MPDTIITKTATEIRRLPSFLGDARLYRLSPPLTGQGWDHDKTYEFVAVSAVVAMFTGPETYIFGADADGEVVEWSELDGSFRGELDHIEALSNAGYSVTVGAE